YIQTAAFTVAWVHGVIGLHYWLRLKTWYRRALPYGFALAIVIPLCAWLGYVEGGREVLRLAEDSDWLRQAVAAMNLPPPDVAVGIKRVIGVYFFVSAAALAIVALARLGRSLRERRRGIVRIAYPNGRTTSFPRGRSILEVSRGAGIPHAS